MSRGESELLSDDQASTWDRASLGRRGLGTVYGPEIARHPGRHRGRTVQTLPFDQTT